MILLVPAPAPVHVRLIFNTATDTATNTFAASGHALADAGGVVHADSFVGAAGHNPGDDNPKTIHATIVKRCISDTWWKQNRGKMVRPGSASHGATVLPKSSPASV